MKKLTYENIAHAEELNVYLEQGNRVLDALGYTDHYDKTYIFTYLAAYRKKATPNF